MKKLTPILTLLFLLGCASFPTQVYHTENTAVDTVTASVHAYNLYYAASTNGATAQATAQYNQERANVYAAVKKFQAAAKAVDQARLDYAANASNTNLTTLQAVLSTLTSQQANVITLIQQFTSH